VLFRKQQQTTNMDKVSAASSKQPPSPWPGHPGVMRQQHRNHGPLLSNSSSSVAATLHCCIKLTTFMLRPE
jgi:hypothetical protein